MQWDSPQVPERWSDLFSCPLSLAGTSKDDCLLISEGAAGSSQASPPHLSPSYLPFAVTELSSTSDLRGKNPQDQHFRRTHVWIF